ncbi:Uncharacterised protein [Mycobacteroides abscessus]|nr:Uncharacterised protein [Mycobacteroides abscessus]
MPVTVERDQPLRSGWDGLEVLVGMPPSFLGQIGILGTDASDDGVGGVVVSVLGEADPEVPAVLSTEQSDVCGRQTHSQPLLG